MKRFVMLCLPLSLAACASPQTTALEPVTLSNGQKVQGVVSIAAHPSGAAPAVTMLQSFDVSTPGTTVLLATESATSAGISTVLAGSLPGAAPALVNSSSSRGKTETIITNNVRSRNDASANQVAIAASQNENQNQNDTSAVNIN